LREILAAWLENYEEAHGDRCLVISEHSFFMPKGKRDYQPDVGIVTDSRKNRRFDPERWISGVPNIALEILSPSTRQRDLGLKARRYFEQGAAEYWIFDPIEETARFLRRGAAGWVGGSRSTGTFSTKQLPGFVLDLDRLWLRLAAKLRLRRPH
jgi:Uma2 family endonuclease